MQGLVPQQRGDRQRLPGLPERDRDGRGPFLPPGWRERGGRPWPLHRGCRLAGGYPHASDPEHGVERVGRQRMPPGRRGGRIAAAGVLRDPRRGHPVEQVRKGAAAGGQDRVAHSQKASPRRGGRSGGRWRDRGQRPLRSADDHDSGTGSVVAANGRAARAELQKRGCDLLHRMLLPSRPGSRAGFRPGESPADLAAAEANGARPPVLVAGRGRLAPSREAGLRHDGRRSGTFCSGLVLPNRTRSWQGDPSCDPLPGRSGGRSRKIASCRSESPLGPVEDRGVGSIAAAEAARRR